jgi:hypothetical protein
LFQRFDCSTVQGLEPDQAATRRRCERLGFGLGSTRGSSYVSVNGTPLVNAWDYVEWGVAGVNPYLQRITFYQNSSVTQNTHGTIHVVVNGVSFNALKFSVDDALRLVFVDLTGVPPGDGSFEQPWTNPTSMVGDLKAGDVVYFRAGTYDQVYADLGANFHLRGVSGRATA